MGLTISSDSIPHGQKRAFIYMLVNGIEIEDYEHDDYFASYRLRKDAVHLFQGLHPGLYLISYTKIHSFMNLISKRENELFRVNVMYDHLDYDSPYKCGNYVFNVSRKESFDMYNEMEKRLESKGDKKDEQDIAEPNVPFWNYHSLSPLFCYIVRLMNN